jgi:hypothetical protein
MPHEEIHLTHDFLDENRLSFNEVVNSKEVRSLAIWCKNNFCSGGALHIIIEDGSYADDDIEHCLKLINSGEWSEFCKKKGLKENTKEHNENMLLLLELIIPLTPQKREMIIQGKTITEELFDLLYNKALS